MQSNGLERVRGPIVAMTTPIKEDNSVDYEGLARLTEFYVKNGIKVLIAAGTTGYCYTLTEEEHRRVVETVVKVSNGTAFIISGVSHSGTMISNRLADICENTGADALLMTPPYYHQTDRPDNIFRHYKDVAQNHSLPMIIYNTGRANLDINFFRRCADIDNVVGVKEASANYNTCRDLLIELGDRFTIFGGGSMRYYLWLWLWGSPAYVTSIANLVPEIELQFYQYLEKGDIESAKKIVIELEQPFFDIMGKYGWHESLHAALKLFGLPANRLRLPLTEPPESYQKEMKKGFIKLGLLKMDCKGVKSQ